MGCWQGLRCALSCSMGFIAEPQELLVIEGAQLPLFQARKSPSVPACPWVSSRWRAQLSFGQQSARQEGRLLGVDWFSGNPVSSGAQGILRMAAKHLEMPASRAKSLFFPWELMGVGVSSLVSHQPVFWIGKMASSEVGKKLNFLCRCCWVASPVFPLPILTTTLYNK